MRLQNWVVVLAVAAGGLACSPNTVSSGADAGTENTVHDAGSADGGSTDAGSANAYPPPPYGVSVNRVIQNFTFHGYLSTTDNVIVNTLTFSDTIDLQQIRTTVDASGNPFRFLLLDISAGWCPPCNQEAQDLGLNGTSKDLISTWLGKGGLFMTVLVEGYDESTHAAPVAADLQTWINAHNVPYSMAFDPDQTLIKAGISPSAFPTNLVIDLRTMTIVSAWYGIDSTYVKWEAALASP